MSGDKDHAGFRQKLDDNHDWPCVYLFKFIVPEAKKDAFNSIFPAKDLTFKSSKGGKYVSVTANVFMHSSDEVIRIYEEAAKIKGVISL